MKRPIHDIAIEKCGFYLPERARYDRLLNLPESENLAQEVKAAMEDIEKYTSELADTLPKGFLILHAEAEACLLRQPTISSVIKNRENAGKMIRSRKKESEARSFLF